MSIDKELRSVIILQSGGQKSENGCFAEIEDFILNNMGNIKFCRTIVRGEPTNFVDDLCMKNC